MAQAPFNMFDCFPGDLGIERHHLNTDTLKIYLTNNTPNPATHVKKADLAGITEQNGYAPADIQNGYSQAGGVGTLTGQDVTFTASGGSFGPFRYAVLYNDDDTNDALIAFWDYESSFSVGVGEQFKVDFGASILTIQEGT